MIEASYVGNRDTRLNINRELSYTPAQYLSTSPFRDQATIDYLGQTFPNPYYGLNPIYGSTITRGSILRNYSEFSSVQITGDPAGYSWYHSLQMRSSAASPTASPSSPPTPGPRRWRPRSS